MRLETISFTATIQHLKPALQRVEGLRIQSPGVALIVGGSVLALYMLLLPFIGRSWRTTGDEPHYLLAAHSLATDLDFDLSNNYAEFDYLAFYLSKDIVPQVRLNAAGQQILDHYPALPLIVAPAYALGGHFGVLLFQSILGGMLALVTYKLAYLVSQDGTSSLLAVLFVTLSPPLLLYHFLIYPELLAALLVTSILYVALSQHRATPSTALLSLISLTALPWLNRRFVPLTIALALLLIWRWRRQRGLVVSLIVPAFSIGLLIWFNSQLNAPLRADITAPANGLTFWSRLTRGGVGWLIDQQRGLLIYAPIYAAAVWGVPALLDTNRRHRSYNWLILLPFLLSLGVVTVAGGFWIGWELGPRFLVVALPSLAPLLALAWRSYGRRRLWAGAMIVLFAISLLNSAVIIRNPELPYKSSLPLYYGERLGLPLTALLPDLAEYAHLSPADAESALIPVTGTPGDSAWLAPAGDQLNLLSPKPLTDLTFGHYRLSWPLRTEPDLPPDTELARLSIKYLGGGQLVNRRITAADLPADGSYGIVQLDFFNANVDRWRTPMVLHATSTGQAGLWARELWLRPSSVYAIILPYLYLILLALGALIAWHRHGKFGSAPHGVLPGEVRQTSSQPSRLVKIGWLWLIVALTVGGVYLYYDQTRSSRTYDSKDLGHFAGQPVPDIDARDGSAWLVDPSVDPPQKAIFGPFDFYDAGLYQVTFRLKLTEPVETSQEIARLQVNATANFEPLVTQPILLEHFSRPNLYHDMVLTLNNPRRQALSFDIHYLGVAPLAIDQVTIREVD